MVETHALYRQVGETQSLLRYSRRLGRRKAATVQKTTLKLKLN